ncbi:MAG: response regulator [Desulfobacter sp.]|nr:MAG: response regulator [Desulfobacter sp.]
MSDLSNMRILVVDDVESNIDILIEMLGEDYRVSVAMNGRSALEDVASMMPDLILLDIMMPDMDGYEVCRRLKADRQTRDIPVVFLTSLSEESDEARGLALGAVDYITKPFSRELVKARVNNHLELKRHRDHLEELVAERTRELILTQDVTIESLGTLAEFRDPETGGHIKRTQHYLRCLAGRLMKVPEFADRLDDATINLMIKSAPLHDIGKVGVPDHILLKPAELTDEEYEQIKKHTIYGRDAVIASEKKLGDDSFLKCARRMAFTHHEKWDGSGYPQGLAGEEIPLEGRLMAIVDVYDALVSKRVYKSPLPHSKAVAMIMEGRGTRFDPRIVDEFKSVSEEFRRTALEFAEHDEERQTLLK